ncbi:SDR family oxidoreductase [Nocardioides marmorisolisilvae]|uniref:SDR family oxidoreductase n=1 Tax=Nocardioides marmorisolisilvae TaxID=1542737 RepID=UPI001C835A0D|nr:SDR family oxidoreductase [Nocardioides marmorisolisilvae]
MKVHLVTGAGSGIGADLAARLEARGDRVVRVTRDVVDLADADAVRRWAEALDEPRLDSLVHMAGTVELETVADLDVSSWRRQIEVNLTAPAVMTGPLLPALRAAGGTVVFVNSSAGLVANAEWSAYAASKFGLRALADALRAEEAGSGVRVTTIFPSRTATPMQEKVHEQEGRTYDATRWIQPGTVTDSILHVLDLPPDASVPELTIRPR